MGKGGQKSETSKQAPARKTKAAVDRRQNNRMLGQCPSGIAQRLPHYAIAVPPAVQNSHKDNVRNSAVGKQLKQKKSNAQVQLHLPALDLFWASSRESSSPPSSWSRPDSILLPISVNSFVAPLGHHSYDVIGSEFHICL